MNVEGIDVFLELKRIIEQVWLGEVSFLAVVQVVGENLRLESQNIRNPILQRECFLPNNLDGDALVIAVHLPYGTSVGVFEPDAHQTVSPKGADLQLLAVVRQADPFRLPVVEVGVDDGAVGVDDKPQSVGLVILEVAYVILKVVSLQDAETVPLVGRIHEPLVNPVNQMSAYDFVVVNGGLWQGVDVLARVDVVDRVKSLR